MIEKKDLKERIKFAVMLWLFVALVLWFVSLLGCSEGYEDGWSWVITNEDGDRETAMLKWDRHEVRVNDDILLSAPHLHCKDGHYHDPYTKIEYCLPEGFTNMEMLHLYRVGK